MSVSEYYLLYVLQRRLIQESFWQEWASNLAVAISHCSTLHFVCRLMIWTTAATETWTLRKIRIVNWNIVIIVFNVIYNKTVFISLTCTCLSWLLLITHTFLSQICRDFQIIWLLHSTENFQQVIIKYHIITLKHTELLWNTDIRKASNYQ